MADGSSLGARHYVSQVNQRQVKDTGMIAGMYSYSFLIAHEYWSIHAGICVIQYPNPITSNPGIPHLDARFHDHPVDTRCNSCIQAYLYLLHRPEYRSALAQSSPPPSPAGHQSGN